MNDNTSSTLRHIGGIDANNLKTILEDFDITKNESHEHFITSNYYDFESVVKVLSNQGSKFTLLTLNIESLNAKFDKLTAFLSMLSEEKIQFDAINIQETWLPDPEKKQIIKYLKYQVTNLFLKGINVAVKVD